MEQQHQAFSLNQADKSVGTTRQDFSLDLVIPTHSKDPP